MFVNYLKSVGLGELIPYIGEVELNDIVEKAFAAKFLNLSEEDVKKLYVYDVPKISPDGSCSIIEEKAEKPYNLAETFGLSDSFVELKNNSHTLRLWRLNKIVHEIYCLSGVEWFGIYRKVKNPAGVLVLAKESYEGLFSRAEFALTEEFAKKSNNSTVGLSGRAIVIQDVAAHDGVYYKCDGKVKSEFCLPILDSLQTVIGIIDAESFVVNHFSSERLLQIAMVAYDLGRRDLGL